MSCEPVNKARKMTDTTNGSHLTIKTDKSIEELKTAVKAAHNIVNTSRQNKSKYNDISDDNTVLKFKKLSENATTPIRGSQNAAGFDLCSAENKVIAANGHGIVKTDIAVMLPKGTYGRVAPRSGLAVKNFVDVGAGVVDYDYRGNVGVVLFNHLHKDFEVTKGMRVAQFIVEKICMPKLVQVEELTETERGENGYGSTGLH
ncbi:uncharacterized protein LOC130644963 [Hydractinia symbiolongicarpus]|uniref:uncharacterized protein LOC130644963 n=1 Tax=Hydractinia symbiolongicarpus TaxID=13093 RepID=UPI00254CF5AA|nr:uncharacterized protein LOC130644963 [Hydractinia symbiolongicarpus]